MSPLKGNNKGNVKKTNDKVGVKPSEGLSINNHKGMKKSKPKYPNSVIFFNVVVEKVDLLSI